MMSNVDRLALIDVTLAVVTMIFVTFFFFFFQAEDGIRDLTVTGVQTCALPIYVYDMGACITVIRVFLKVLQGLTEHLPHSVRVHTLSLSMSKKIPPRSAHP